MANGIATPNKPSFENPSYVDDFVLSMWSQAAEDEQHLEIIRLAGVGLIVEANLEAIKDALKLAMGEMPIARVSRFEKALDALMRGAP